MFSLIRIGKSFQFLEKIFVLSIHLYILGLQFVFSTGNRKLQQSKTYGKFNTMPLNNVSKSDMFVHFPKPR